MSILLDKEIYKPKSIVICVYPMQGFYFNQHAIFEKFGKLRFVGIDKRKGVRIGFIEFENDSVSNELISKGYMEIEDNKCEVQSYEEFKRKSKLVSATLLKLDCAIGALLQPPEQDSYRHILNVLNDDCLREIFKKLHFSTLMSVVNVCTRFHRVAKEAFASKYKSKKIHISDLAWNRLPTISQVNNFLREFGSSISSVSLMGRGIGRYVGKKTNNHTHLYLRMISKYCNGLKELEFCGSNIPESTLYEIFSKLKTLFERLRTLRIHFINSRSFFEIISGCVNLEVLDVYFGDIMEPLIPSNTILPKLIEASFDWGWYDISSCRAMHKFLELNSKLQKLRIVASSDLVTSVGNLKELKEFDIRVTHKNFSSTVATLSSPNIRIENLKVNSLISMYYYGPYDLALIPTLGNVTEFRQRDKLTFDEMIYLAKHLPNLETLQTRLSCKTLSTKNETIMTIKSIVEHAPKLSKLLFDGCSTILFIKLDEHPYLSFPIDDVDYYNILKTVEDRASGIKLTIQFVLHKTLHDDNVRNSQAIFILNKVSKLLTIEQRVIPKYFKYPI